MEVVNMNQKTDMPITQGRIISASWDLLRTEGIENFTMRKLAQHLDIKAASLYWHFKSKQHIFQVLANEVSKEILLSAQKEGDWKEQLHKFGNNFRVQLIKYPCSAQLLMQTPPSGSEYLTLINSMLLIIEPLPLSDRDKFSSIACLMNYILSFELDGYECEKINIAIKNEGTDDALESTNQSIEDLPDNAAGSLRRMHCNNIFNELGSDRMFQTGLNIIVLGIEKLSSL
jgi:AcrR family transcriptional regulator